MIHPLSQDSEYFRVYNASSSGRGICVWGFCFLPVFMNSFFFLGHAALRISYSSRWRSKKLSALFRFLFYFAL